MQTMIKMFFALFIFSLCMFLILFFFIATLLTGDVKLTYNIIINAFKIRFEKKEQAEYIENAYILINDAFKEVYGAISEAKDKEISDLLDIKIQEAKKFKKEINQTLKEDNFEFFTKKEIKSILKSEKLLNPIVLIQKEVKLCADPRIIEATSLQRKTQTNKKKRNIQQLKDKFLLGIDKININSEVGVIYNKLVA